MSPSTSTSTTATSSAKQLIVFDFDWSFVDQDTDRFVLEVLSTKLRRKLQTLKNGTQVDAEDGAASKIKSQCTPDVVAECMLDLYHTEHKSKDEILDALRLLPLHPAMKRAVTSLKSRSPETTFVCISNSNEVYIDTILKHHSLTDLFHTIITNPAHFDKEHPDCLHVGRRIPADSPNQHDCKVGCLVNMCKGEELDQWIAKNSKGWDQWDRVVYIGDGEADEHALRHLWSFRQDLCLVRKDMELHERIRQEAAQAGLKAQVKYWTGAWEIDEYFFDL